MLASAAVRMKQSFWEFEAEYRARALEERSRDELRLRQAAERSRERRHRRVQKHGTLRFIALVCAIVATSVVVTIVMFETLALLIGG